MSANKNSRKTEIYKATDFRRELSFREKKVAEIKREKMRILADVKTVPRYVITVDLSHARGNLDAVKMCLRHLEWKERAFSQTLEIKRSHMDPDPDERLLIWVGRIQALESKVKVTNKGQMFFNFRVRSISLQPLEGFHNAVAQMFTSTRQCAEVMIQACFSQIKITIEGLVQVLQSYVPLDLDKILVITKYPFGRKDQHCDIHWHCTNFEQNPDLYGGKVNKFPGMCWICSKMNLFRVLDQMRTLYPDEYDFYPRTWYLPDQLHQLAHDIRKVNEKRTKPRATFIIKPDSGSQGEGIYLIRDISDYIVNTGRTHVCQEYLSDVLLIDKYKFDLRVYAVLKSIEPLEFYICKEGLARFSTVPYENPTNKNLHETFMHLTNYSLNKRSSTFNRSERDDEGSKRTLSSVFNRLKRYGYNTEKIWKRIEQIIVKTMIAIIPDLKIEMQATLPANKPGPTCFQILGFDILLLHNLKPVLLEINSSPSLRIDSEVEVAPGVMDYVQSPKDEEVKIPLIRDTLILMAPKSKLAYLQSHRRRKARQERRRKQREEEERIQREQEENRLPAQMERDGVIHVETNHPRSSIVIIRSDDDNVQSQKKMARESSFTLPNVHNVVTNRQETDYFSRGDPNETTGETAECFEQMNIQDTEQSSDVIDRNNNNESSEKETVKPELEDIEEDHNHENADSDEEKTEESEMWEPCLMQLYPDCYSERYDKLRLYEKLADVFMICLGVRATQRLGPTGFRTFARKCRLNRRGLTNAAVDILYIDVQRKWEHVNPERTTGLCFRGFLDACHEIARRKFTNGNVLQTMEDFIDYCEENLHEEQAYARYAPRLLMRRARPHGYPHLDPMVNSPSPVLEDQQGILLESRLRNYLKPKSAEDVDVFLRRHRQLEAIPYKSKSGRRVKSRQKNCEN